MTLRGRPEGPRECLVTNHAAECFVRLTDETEAAVLGALAGRTLADSLDSCARSTVPAVPPPRQPVTGSPPELG
jgi:Rrf2 family transcriptional repressor of oqxAB